MVEVSIEKVSLENKSRLSKMIAVYLKELSKYRANQDNKEYKYLNLYFSRPERLPFFVKTGSSIVGFVLVILRDPLSDVKRHTIAEFYIKPKFRNKGIGRTTAKKIFDMFRGPWIIRQLEGNPSRYFWEKIVDEYTQGNFRKVKLNDDKWKGFAQLFDNS